MDKNLHQIAKAPMIALIEKKNIMENKMKRAFVLLLLLGLMMPLAMQAQDFGNPSRAINECRKPTQLTVSQITANSAQLSWTENGDADTWIVAYRTDDDDDFNEVITAENPYNLTGLTPEIEYTVKVKPVCEMDKWSDPLNFVLSAKLIIGSGDGTCAILPTCHYFEYSLTEQIYTVEELGDAGLIEIIDFFNVSTNGCDRDLDIYLVSTDKSSFENSSDWIAVTEADRCFSGTVSFANNAWTSIVLDAPFLYDGIQNVAIVVDDHTGSWSHNYMSFLSFTTSTDQAIYQHNDGTKGGGGSGITNSKNQVRVLKGEIGDCMRPTNFTVSEVGPDFANLSWVEYGTSTTWVIDYNGATVTTTENPYTLSGLGNETDYTVKVRPACDENLWSAAITFTTLESCPAPTGLQVDNMTATTATLSWTGFSESYIVRYRTSMVRGERGATASEWQTYYTSEPTLTLTGLVPETDYEAQVQGDCGNDDYSEWSEIITFTTESDWFAGSGTEDDPYIIATTDDMDELADQVNSGNDYSGTYFLMTEDLDYLGKDYMPVGIQTAFRGFFDGNNHTISNAIMRYSYSDYIGVFGKVGTDGTVQNLMLDQSSIGGGDYVGGIAGYCQGSVLNCTVGTNVSVTGNNYVGGIVGCFAGDTIRDCVNAASVNGAGEVGGIIGSSDFTSASPSGQITSCRNSGRIESMGYFCGGIGGKFSIHGDLVAQGFTFTVTGCANTGEVIGYKTVGGIVGMSSYTIVSNCLNLGRISAPAQIPNYVQKIGGVIGRSDYGTVASNNYYTGDYYYYEDELGNEQTGQLGGINFQDITNQAMRGYKIEPQDPLVINLEGSIGLAYEGSVYAGNEQSVVVGLNTPITPQCYILSAGTIVDNGNDIYTITMPAEDITISGNIVEFYGTYYEIPCNGDTTATVIYDDSYLTLEHVDIEDFECLGKQYTVTAIADGAFDGCDSIIYFDCHSNISTIGDHAMRNCTGIDYFGFYHTPTPPTLGEGVFEGLSLDTLWLMVPFCSRYEYAIHPVWGQFGEIQPDGECQYNFIGMGSDQLWSTPENWAEGEVPVEGAQVGIMSDCEMDADVTVGSITIGGYYDEEYGCYEHLTVKDSATLTATSYIYNTGDERNFIIEDGAQVVHPNAGAKATVQKAVSAYSTQSGVNNGWHLIALPITGSIDVDSVGNMIGGEYDLYAYDETTAYWKNSKNTENSFTALEATKGYLYAHGEDVTLEFSGTLQNSSDTISVPLSYTTVAHLSGFNLVGNPFPCEAYLDREYYVLSANGTEISSEAIPSTVPIPPCTAVFVKAVDEGDSVVFTRVAP